MCLIAQLKATKVYTQVSDLLPGVSVSKGTSYKIKAGFRDIFTHSIVVRHK